MKKILILRLSSIGDIVLTQPVTAVLREQFPDAEIDYLTKPAYLKVVQAFGTIDSIYLWENKTELLHNLRQRKYDLIIDLHAKLNTVLLSMILPARKKITVNKRHLNRLMLIKKLKKTSEDTAVNRYLKVLGKIGIRRRDINPQLKAEKQYQADITAQLKKINKRHDEILVGIFPGALHKTKQYPPGQYSDFISLVPTEYKCIFVLLGSPAEKELCREIKNRTAEAVHDLCGELSLGQLFFFIQELDMVISGDTGPMHIASALNIPQLAIFGATHPCLGFSPQNPDARVLVANLKCQPCSLYGNSQCPRKHFKCMSSITPQLLLDNFTDHI
ncbi:MAG: glycosyltransferase family 9 protein, partial [Candidatus Cloacimonetes bacterium]|nr:glycosyltransferase family 9 protein [Candidatus Cloacimonadota bacterium]